MVSLLRKGRLAILIILCQALFQIQTLSLQAEEIAVKDAPQGGAVTAPKAEEGVEGIASYYAKRYNGRRTHSGARYNPKKLTAAHPDLPLGTKVKVVNLEKESEVTVTINDRCRKRSVPFIDLSREAARRLGILGKGRARVLIVSLDEG